MYLLKDEGVQVDWSPPAARDEDRGLAADATQVVIDVVSTGTVAAIAKAARRFRKYCERLPHDARIEVDGEPDDGGFLPDGSHTAGLAGRSGSRQVTHAFGGGTEKSVAWPPVRIMTFSGDV